MMDATELMEGHLIQRERVPGSALQTRQALYFRGDKVIKILQERNDHLQQISNRVEKLVAKRKAEKDLLAEACRIITISECRCKWHGDELFECARCAWIEEYRKALKEDEPCKTSS